MQFVLCERRTVDECKGKRLRNCISLISKQKIFKMEWMIAKLFASKRRTIWAFFKWRRERERERQTESHNFYYIFELFFVEWMQASDVDFAAFYGMRRVRVKQFDSTITKGNGYFWEFSTELLCRNTSNSPAKGWFHLTSFPFHCPFELNTFSSAAVCFHCVNNSLHHVHQSEASRSDIHKKVTWNSKSSSIWTELKGR